MSGQPAIAPQLVQASFFEVLHSPNSTATKLASDLYDWNIATLVSTAITVLCISALWFSRYKRFKDLPKGPCGYPILGCFPMLTHYPELTLDKWARKYGSLYSVRLGNQLFAIVSDPGVAKDLMITQGAIFSYRKEMFMKSQIIFAGRGITATPYNDRWRKHRRVANTWLNQQAVESYTRVLDFEATDMLQALFVDSKNGVAHINPQAYAGRCSLNNMLTITFGFRTDNIHHPIVAEALRLSRAFMNCTGPVSNIVDFVPLLQWLPSPLKSKGKALHRDLVQTYGGMINVIKKKMQAGEKVDECLAKTMLDIQKTEELDHLDMSILASAFMIGGVETTASIMQWFTALIPAYPEVQKRAHEELDRVVGRSRLPTLEDEKNLPYCHAIIKEVERCHNPFWLGTPHTAMEDFVYNGKLIPKDTVVVLNTWTMHHSEKRWENSHDFNPDRYIKDPLPTSASANLADPYARDHWMFGAGRRICPGMIVAEREIWLAISRMLWAFEMVQIPGSPIDLKEYDGLSGRSPVPFEITLKPRFDGVGEIIGKDMKKWKTGGMV